MRAMQCRTSIGCYYWRLPCTVSKDNVCAAEVNRVVTEVSVDELHWCLRAAQPPKLASVRLSLRCTTSVNVIVSSAQQYRQCEHVDRAVMLYKSGQVTAAAAA
jgi:hypothetical protein